MNWTSPRMVGKRHAIAADWHKLIDEQLNKSNFCNLSQVIK
jgi:hypothetical protein